MSIERLTDESGRTIYGFRVWIDGKEFRRSTYQGDKKVAKQKEAEFRTNYAAGGIRKADPRTVRVITGFAPTFLRFCEREKGVRESTLALYRRLLITLGTSRALRNIPLSKISAAEFAEYVEERMESAYQQGKYTALRRERQLLVSLLRYACEIGEIGTVPIIRSPGRGVQRRREFIPDETMFRTYLSASSGYLRDAAVLSASTGMRPGEIADLNTSEIAVVEDGFVIILKQSKSEAGKKPIHVSRVNALGACEVLHRRLDGASASGVLFHELAGTREYRVGLISKAHTRLVRRLKLPAEFVFYSFRHLYVTHAGQSLEPQQLRELARHSDIRTTMIYFNPRESERRRVSSSVKLLLP